MQEGREKFNKRGGPTSPLELQRMHAYSLMPFLDYVGCTRNVQGVSAQNDCRRPTDRRKHGQNRKDPAVLLSALNGLNEAADAILSSSFYDVEEQYVWFCDRISNDIDLQRNIYDGLTYKDVAACMERYRQASFACEDTRQRLQSKRFPIQNIHTLLAEYEDAKYRIDKVLMLFNRVYSQMHVDAGLILRIITDNILSRECSGFSSICNFRYVDGTLNLIWEDRQKYLSTRNAWFNVEVRNNKLYMVKSAD